MKAYKFLIPILAAALPLGIAACGGGGGGAADPNPAFTTTVSLEQVAGAVFSAGLALNDDALVVGRTDGGVTPTTPKAAAWTVTPGTPPAAPTTAIALLALPAPNGPYGSANGVNNEGAIAGNMEVTASGLIVPAFWADNLATAEPLALGLTADRGSAYDINTTGKIVGEVVDAGVTMAVSWESSAATAPAPLPTTTLNPPTTSSSAYFVNDFGDIVGELTDAAGTHAVVWRLVAGVYDDPILLTPPDTLAGSGIALSTNASGFIVGEVEDTASGLVHAVRWEPGTGTEFTAVDLGAVAVNSGASGINDAGRTVGYVDTLASAWGPVEPTFVTMDAALIDSKAMAINTFAQAVGIASNQAFVALP